MTARHGCGCTMCEFNHQAPARYQPGALSKSLIWTLSLGIIALLSLLLGWWYTPDGSVTYQLAGLSWFALSISALLTLSLSIMAVQRRHDH